MMDFSSLIEMAAGQSPLFWAASVAISLGAGCLAAASTLLIRRRRAFARPPLKQPAGPALSLPRAEPAVHQLLRQTPLLPVGGLADGDRLVPDGEPASLALLLRRLRAAGDRLEEIAHDLDGQPAAAPDSGLKEHLPPVEYVFKASGS